jgi:PAS domain S-box-containing protein
VVLPLIKIEIFVSLIHAPAILILTVSLAYAMLRYGLMVVSPQTLTEDIVKIMPDSLFLISPEAKILRINQEACDLLGYKENELLGQPVGMIFEEEEEEEEIFKGTSLEKIIRERFFRNYKINLINRNKEKIPVMLSGSVLRDKTAELIGIVCIARDLREINELVNRLTEASASLNEKNKALETAVRKLTDSRSATIYMLKDISRTQKELRAVQAQLVQSGKMAAVGQLAAGVAHEINNPLTVAYGFTELLLQEIQSPPIKKDLKKVLKSVERCQDITARILSFARFEPEAKKMEPVDVNKTLELTLSLLGNQLFSKKIKLVRKLAPNLPQVAAIPSHLEQVYMDLIFNAQDAMPQGGTLEIKTIKTKDYVEIRFSDTGDGISEENLECIFEPFFTTKEPGQGVGLGLSVCHGIIKGYSGTLEVESKVGKGSTFIIRLPVKG